MPFLIVDCNNFFVSCERVFDASLVGRPTIVLSSNDGCVVSRSQEAKDIGIKMGEPAFQCRDKISRHNVAVRSANFALYGDLSHRVMDILSAFSDKMEIYSIDEAFLTFSAGQRRKAIDDVTEEIQRRVQKWTGIPVSIGVAPTKTLAKIANGMAKRRPDLQRSVYFEDASSTRLDPILADLAVESIWGIGPRSGATLRSYGIRTALALKTAPEYTINKRLGVTGLRTQMEIKGAPCLQLDGGASRKMVLCSRSFGRPVHEIGPLREAITLYMSRAADRLRRQGGAARMVQVFMRTDPHRRDQPQSTDARTVTLPVATNYTPTLVAEAHRVLEQIYKPGYAYNKAGVLLLDLCPENAVQLNLFDTSLTDGERERQRRLMRAVDTLNRQLGEGTVFLAGAGVDRAWSSRHQHRSPRYTTRWDEIFTVGA